MHIPTCWDKAGQSAGQTLTSLQDICPYSAPTTPPNWDCLYACNWLISRVRPQFHPQLCHFLAMKREEVPFILLRLTFLMHKGRKIVYTCPPGLGVISKSTQELRTHISGLHTLAPLTGWELLFGGGGSLLWATLQQPSSQVQPTRSSQVLSAGITPQAERQGPSPCNDPR